MDHFEEFKQSNMWRWVEGKLMKSGAQSGIYTVTSVIYYGFYCQLFQATEKRPGMTHEEVEAIQDTGYHNITIWAIGEYRRMGREDVADILTRYILKEYYPAPTAVERFQHVYGETLPIPETKTRYKGVERHYVYSGVFKEPTELQLDLPGILSDNELDQLDKQIMECTDALALKVFHAVFSECYRQHKDWGAWCYWDLNTFCDLLGYKRDKKGYHRSANVRQVERRLRALSELQYRFELLGYDPRTGANKIHFDGTLISIEPKQTVSLFKDSIRIARKSTLRIHDELYNAMMNRSMFAWYDAEFLKLHPQQHKRAILLYSYYTSQLAMGARQRKRSKHIVKRPLKTVLRETGIKIDKRVKKREMDSFFDAHAELNSRGLIKDFSLSPVEGGRVEIAFHENHPALQKHHRTRLTPGEGLIPGR